MLERPSDNITGRAYPINGVRRPSSTQEVMSIVKTAREHGQRLYPTSTGFNWGYGSASPAAENCLLVDLSRMNRILNADRISVDNPVAVIEPGVSQGQLADFLRQHCPELTFNVTGSGRGTSILGNSLDRGVGYFGPRKDDLFGLEVVTGAGKLLHTGYRRLGENSPLAHAHPFGLGPMLDGLFFQGNFGIVTSACFRLLPRRPVEVAVSMALRSTALLPGFIDELARLKREGLLTSVTHIANKARTHSTLMYGITAYLEQCGYRGDAALQQAKQALNVAAPDEWASLAAVTGNRGQVSAALKEIKARLQPFAKVRVVTEQLLDFGAMMLKPFGFLAAARAYSAAIAAIRPLHQLALGEPTDVAIDNLLWKFGAAGKPPEHLDESRCGLLFINPALPLNGAFVARVVGAMEEVARQFQHPLYITINIETSTSLVGVVNLLFNRDQIEETERAHRCADALLACIREHGLEPYRLRADMMSSVIAPESEYWQTVRRLKCVLDPDNIIAPGRYNLVD